MVASQATMEAHVASLPLALASQMENLAAKGDWRRTEQLALQIREALLHVPENERRPMMMSIGKSLERVQTMVLTSRVEVTEKLSGIRRGRAATRAYGQPDLGATRG